MIQAIIFDCFGVLTTDTWRAFLDGLPESVDREPARQLNRAYDAGIIDRETFLRQVKEVTGSEPRQVEAMLANEVAKNTPLLDYIQDLKKDYRIGLLSNVATPWITESFLTAREQELFDSMVFSYQVGMTKPDPRIFLLACERLRVAPKEAVLVDDIDRYCEAARAEGLQAVVYQDIPQLKRELEVILSHE